MAGDPWDGALGDAFDVDSTNTKSASQKTPPTPKKTSSSKTPPKPGAATEQNFEDKREDEQQSSKEADVKNEYPADTKGEAVESLKRAANVEDYNNFQKVASAIEEEHPDALNDFEQLEKVSYIVGRNMAEGIYDELADKS